MFMMSSSKGCNLVGDPQLPAPGVTAPHQVSNRLLPSDSQPSPAGGSAASARVLGLRVTPVTRCGGATLCPAPPRLAGEGRAELHRGRAWRASLAVGLGPRVPRLRSPPGTARGGIRPPLHLIPTRTTLAPRLASAVPLSHPDANTQRNSFKDATLNKPLGGSSQENRQQVKSCLYLQSVRTPSLTSRPPHTHAESSSVNSTIRIGLKIKISFCRYVIQSPSLPRGDRASGVSAAPGEVPGPAQRRGLQSRLEGIHGEWVL